VGLFYSEKPATSAFRPRATGCLWRLPVLLLALVVLIGLLRKKKGSK